MIIINFRCFSRDWTVMNSSPFSTAFIAKLMSTFACHMITCFGFLHNDSTFITFAVIILHVQNHCFVFRAFTTVFEVHALSTKLFLALNALKRLVFNHRYDTLTVLRRTHPQEWVIGCEVEFWYFVEQLFRFRVQGLEKCSLLVKLCVTWLLWAFW